MSPALRIMHIPGLLPGDLVFFLFVSSTSRNGLLFPPPIWLYPGGAECFFIIFCNINDVLMVIVILQAHKLHDGTSERMLKTLRNKNLYVPLSCFGTEEVVWSRENKAGETGQKKSII